MEKTDETVRTDVVDPMVEGMEDTEDEAVEDLLGSAGGPELVAAISSSTVSRLPSFRGTASPFLTTKAGTVVAEVTEDAAAEVVMAVR